MSHPRTDSDGNPTSKRGQHRTPSSDTRNTQVDAQPPISLLPDANRDFSYTMRQYALLDHGYLKIRRGALSADLHCTYTWSLGKNQGSYVYVRGEFWEMPYLLETLLQKIEEVDKGLRRPSPDKYQH